MHICRVTRAFLPFRDGISHHTYYLSRHQAALGHKVWVLQPHYAPGKLAGFEVKRLPLGPLTSRYGDKSVTTLFAILAGVAAIRLHKRYRLDVLHGHGDILEALMLKQVTKVLNISLVMTVHSGLNCRWHYRQISPHVWRLVDGLIAVSPYIASDLQSLRVSPRRLTVISSGVELSRFTPATEESRRKARATLGIPDDAFVITSVGSLTPVKGFRYLIEAVQRLPGTKALTLWIIGNGPLRAELEAIARKGTSQVHLLGSQPHDRVQLHLHAANLYVFSSIDQPGVIEGTPTAVMEAMATGLPVVTPDSGSAQHVIMAIPGLTLVPQRDSGALAGAIGRLVQDAAACQRIGACNRERVASRDWPSIATSVCQFYESIMGRTP
jgi:glycosyltransferase involved in cell wall biosynthesis